LIGLSVVNIIMAAEKKLSSEELRKMENEYVAHNYHPLPVTFAKAKGVMVTDPEGKEYYDFLSAYSAVNQGHCHPKIVKALVEQAETCSLSSRAFFNDKLPLWGKFITEYFKQKYEMVLPMNTGAEAVETAIKVAKKWGYMKKGIPKGEGKLICCNGNFHGRTLQVISMSDDPSSYEGYQPLAPGIIKINYNDVKALEEQLEKHGKEIYAFVVEPIQGEAGIFVPDEGYLTKCAALCKKHNVLFVADEVQTGLSRTGRLLCVDWEDVRPDIVVLGKAISGGVYPISCIMADKEIMLCIKPGEHGSTYGGNPVAAAVSIAALSVLKDENLTEKADKLGIRLRAGLNELKKTFDFIKVIRGKGLLNAIEIDPKFFRSAWQICLLFKKHGLLCKPTHDHIIRLAPPLVITEEQIDKCLEIFKTTLKDAVDKSVVVTE